MTIFIVRVNAGARRTIGLDGTDRVEPHSSLTGGDPRCDIPFPGREELVTHLYHDHNHTEPEAERIVDRVAGN